MPAIRKGKPPLGGLITVLTVLFIIGISVALRKQFFLSGEEGFSLWFSVLEAVGLVITVALAIIQLKDSKEISRADFIVNLNQAFVENPEYQAVYDKLQACLDGSCSQKKDGICLLEDCELGISKSDISNYLTFFETIYILHKRKVISFDIIDDLFAYRFFLAVHSRYIQKMKLIPQPENFRNIFLLEKEWLEYRDRIGKTPAKEVAASCERYRRELEQWKQDPSRKPDTHWPNVYVARPLRAVVDPEQYEALTH